MNRQQPPSDRRGFGRRESRVHAVARIPGRGQEPCVVRNFSDGGALLEFTVPPKLNGSLRLIVESKGLDVSCEVRHQADRTVGVKFLEEGEAAVSRYAALLAEASAPPQQPKGPVVFEREGVVTLVTGDEMRHRMLTAGKKAS